MLADFLLATTLLLQIGTFILSITALYVFFFTPLFQSNKKSDFEVRKLARSLAASGRAGFFLVVASELFFSIHYFLTHDTVVDLHTYFVRIGLFVLGCVFILLTAFSPLPRHLASFLLFLTSSFYFFVTLYPSYIAKYFLVYGICYGSIILLAVCVSFIQRRK